MGIKDWFAKKAGGPAKVPVDQTLISQVVQGVRDQLKGNPDDWFGPGQPIQPMAPNAEGVRGRQFDYNVAANLRRIPRDGEGVNFHHLRNLADGYDLLRLVIETRKDQMEKLSYTFGPKPEVEKAQKAKDRVAAIKKHADKVKQQNAELLKPQTPPEIDEATGLPKPPPPKPADVPEVPDVPVEDPRIQQLRDFFAFPDQEHGWKTWLRALLEDLFVLDAPTLYPRLTNGGDLHSLELVDGSTIKRILDATGRTPLPPDPAYQQILKGIPAVDYNRDELIYKPRNVRTHKVYGYGPVEQILMTVNIAMRRQISALQFYTEGNIPEALIGVPKEWNPDQIKFFQEYWDSVLEGDTAARRHAKFVPGGMAYMPTRGETLKDDMDEWLSRIICFAFSLSPQALIKMMNRATADTAKDQALSEGLIPVMNWVKDLMDYIIWKYFGWSDLEFKWDEEDEASPLVQMQVLTGYVAAKVMDTDEARDKLGLPAMTEEQKAALAPPPPPPGLPMGLQGGAPNAKVPSDGQPPTNTPAPKAGGTDKPVGKSQAAQLRKSGLKPLSRTRPSVQACTSGITSLMTKALAAAGKRIASQVRDGKVKAEKAISADSRTTSLLKQFTFEELEDIAPDLAELLEDMTQDGGEAALAQVLAEIDKSQLEQVNERAVAYAQDRSADLVKDLESTTRDMLRSTIVSAMESGATNDELADDIEQNYGFSPERSETIARTETAMADVQGNLEGYAASGVVDQKEWVTAQGDFCDDCNDMNGVVVDLTDEFPDEGGDGPPLHPNCRCDILPVLASDSDGS